MPRRSFILVALFTLLLAGLPLESFAAAGPNGFATIPWGADWEKIDNTLRQKGFAPQENTPPANLREFRRSFKGNFLGYDGVLTFSFLQNVFYQGEFVTMETQDNNLMRIWGQQFSTNLTKKYGSPTRRVEGEKGDYDLSWDGLPVPKSADKIDILMWVHFWDGNPATATAKVSMRYTNKTLEQRLQAKQREKSGL